MQVVRNSRSEISGHGRTSWERQDKPIEKKIYRSKNLSYIEKQNKTAITEKKTKRKEKENNNNNKKMKRRERGSARSRTLFLQRVVLYSYHQVTWNTLGKPSKIYYSNLLRQNFGQRDLYKLNMNSKIFFRRMTAVWTVKTQRKRMSSHLKHGSPTKPIRYKLVCEQNVFYYRDFFSYLKANHPKSLPFALKSTLAFEIP